MTARNPELTRRAVMAGVCVAVAGTTAGCSGPEDSGSDNGEQPLGSTSDIPIGGGVVFAELGVVVTQPSKGDIRAFSAICTHRGCTVGSVDNGTIICPCHGSTFSSGDGSVIQGPAEDPLPTRQVIVDGDSVKLVQRRS